MRLSVVIPTRDRRESLRRVLASLQAQVHEVEGGVELVVVDDGSRDGTRDELDGWTREAPQARVALAQERLGPGAARNRGAAAARGEVLVFLGDDTTPQPGFLKAHDTAHREPGASSRAVLGHTAWDAGRLVVTPLLTHLERNGLQFGFALITDPEDVPFSFFYTSNVSLPRELFLSLGGFDESFRGAAWEDIELAYRASRLPVRMRLVYRPAARTLHDHPTTLASFRERQHRSGRAAAVFLRKHPELADFLGVERARDLHPRRLSVSLAAGLIRGLDALRIPLPGRVYDHVLVHEYLVGLHEGLSNAGDGAG